MYHTKVDAKGPTGTDKQSGKDIYFVCLNGNFFAFQVSFSAGNKCTCALYKIGGNVKLRKNDDVILEANLYPKSFNMGFILNWLKYSSKDIIFFKHENGEMQVFSQFI